MAETLALVPTAAGARTTLPAIASVRSARLPSVSLVALFALCAAVLATALPLLTYTVSLAACGLAHVLAELRYVDQRFGSQLGRHLRVQMIALLACVVTGRLAVIAGKIAPGQWQPFELMLVALLALTAVPRLRQARPMAAAFALLVVLALATGAVLAPLGTFLLLAVAHNLTPAGFLAERLRGPQRRGALATCAGLLLVAALIASGQPAAWLAGIDGWRPDFSVLPGVGTLAFHLGQYVPRVWHDTSAGLALFSAAVFLQCLHYGAVLHVLPRLGPPDTGAPARRTIVSWPRQRGFLALVGGASLLLFGGFLVSFSDARALYSLAAAVHAWIEIPLLLVALAPAVDAPANASGSP